MWFKKKELSCFEKKQDVASKVSKIQESIILGQECISPEGLGRVITCRSRYFIENILTVTVRSYINDEEKDWDHRLIEFIDPRKGYDD